MCDEGYDSQFHKKHEYLHPITGKGGYLVGKYYIAAYGTVGGVRINKYGEVMDANLKPIPGLTVLDLMQTQSMVTAITLHCAETPWDLLLTPDVWLVRQSQITLTTTFKSF